MDNDSILSAGTNPKSINPLAIFVMDEINIDISNYYSKSFSDGEMQSSDIIITLCSDAKYQCIKLNSFTNKHIHWDINDPAKASGSIEERLQVFRDVRNQLETKIKLLVNDIN